MTTVEVLFRYALHPSEAAMSALGKLRDVYGIRRIVLREQEQTIRVEYDATRLSMPAVTKLLRSSGIAIAEELPLNTPPPSEPNLPANAASPASAGK